MNALAQKIRRKIVVGRQYANVRGLVFFAQRRLQKARSRQQLARLVARFLPGPATAMSSLSPEAALLRDQGFASLEGIVTPAMVEEMRGYLAQQPVQPTYILNAPLGSIDAPQLPDSHTFQIPERFVVSCPHLLDVANDPKILAAVEGVFGCKPTLGCIVAWWSVPTADGKPRQAENFHRDVDDVNFLKLFIYLTDVDRETGPHEYIRGSHNLPQMSDIKRHTDEEVLQTFGADRLVRFVGPAGTMFLESTFGLHRGLPVRSGRRLILQLIYSMLPMAYGPTTPYRPELFAPTRADVDSYVNRAYVGRP